MERSTARILERSSDAIVIICLADGTVHGANEAFFAVTGHPQDELVGRHVRDLFAQLGPIDGSRTVAALETLGALADAPTGLWTRAGELRCGHLSALLVAGHEEPDAVCTIRDIRDPTPAERRLAARKRFIRTVEAGGPQREVATHAIQALGESLRWEYGALWLMTPETQVLRCAAVWRSPWAGLEALEEASWRTEFLPGVGLVGRSWQAKKAIWVPDNLAEPDRSDPRQQLDEVGGLVRGRFGFPVWASDDVVGFIEFFSREVRQRDEELLQMTEEFGRLIGRLLENAEPPEHLVDEMATPPRGEEPQPETVPSVLRGLGNAAAIVAGAMEREPNVRSIEEAPELLRQLAASVGKLDRLLEDVMELHHGDRPERQPSTVATHPAGDRPSPIPVGLTLKAVSRRTGIPAATIRTWERRYGFVRPMRSANGYRLYGEREIAQVLQVKKLLDQGVRIGAAMDTLRGRTPPPQAVG
jgi:PAS domain S-box-containing protein